MSGPTILASCAPEQVPVRHRIEAGAWEDAIDRAWQVAGCSGVLSAAAAWPAAMVLYLQGDLRAAGAVLRRVPTGGADRPADRALVAGWSACVRWAQGDNAGCRHDADLAYELAQACADPRALATAHTMLALLAAAEGDRRGNDRHYALALTAAERSGDATLVLRIRANRSSQRLEEGDLAGALAELDEALPTEGAHPAMVGLAQHNRASALLRAGRLGAAREQFHTARTTLQRIGSSIVAYPLTGLGECHEVRGALPQARAAYEEAALVARASGLPHSLVPALCGLARVLAATGEPVAAGQAAARAVAESTALTEASANAAVGWAVCATDPAVAREHADKAIALGRAGRDPAGLADGLELAAMSRWALAERQRTDEPDRLLADAERVWGDIGDPLGSARIAYARARLGTGAAATAARVVAEYRLRALEIDPAAGTRSLAHGPRVSDNAVSVRMLGSFAVLHRGEVLPATAWQSRKARDVLKLLIARRGRPMTRDAIGAALWPGESKVGNRLSIALSILRTVLDPDRKFPPDRFLVAGAAGVAYRPDALPVDVDVFLQIAAAGIAAQRAGRAGEARMLLAAADAAYTGDVLDDEPDLEAVLPLRDEAHTMFLATLRALGAAGEQAEDVDGAVGAWSRLLRHDPYDEDSALRLIAVLQAAGRHGEATRQHQTYVRRMRELDLPAAPMPRPPGGTGQLPRTR
ncbi:BTAD domain-containing putative transcriptional regulator [Actinoplanes sp. NPDC051859]|uniref:BTAD domain-containing putative transcriptional regulator n=1 Tax=Actinoplanes sp. NPDC051859 TaxID=3363909 RepID=UPI0037AA546A